MDVLIEQVLSEISTCVKQVSAEHLSQASSLIARSQRVFVYGAGRSGLCMRGFGMRLMHLGKKVFVVGETTTTRISSLDLLILGSGSGKTESLLVIAEKARVQGAEILLFTTDPASPLAQLADHAVCIPAPSYKRSGIGSVSKQPLGTLFEQSLLILCDCLIIKLMQQKNVNVTQMLERHANLE